MFILRWLWKNMKGDRALYIFALFLTIVSQSMYIITPYFTQQIVDTFLVGEQAAENLRTGSDLLLRMIFAMVGFTLLRCIIQYSANMSYEKTSQGMIYRIRKVLFDKIEAQDASFYNRYRTGDIMTRVTSDLDMIRHSVAWIIKTTLECVILFSVSVVYFFSIDWLMAICMLILTPLHADHANGVVNLLEMQKVQTLILPEDVVKDTINACMCDGVLCIELPRKSPEQKNSIAKVIEIK